MTSAGPARLQVCLDVLLLQIQFAFDLAQHLVVDAPLVAQSNNSSSFGCQYFLAQAAFGLLPISITFIRFS